MTSLGKSMSARSTALTPTSGNAMRNTATMLLASKEIASEMMQHGKQMYKAMKDNRKAISSYRAL